MSKAIIVRINDSPFYIETDNSVEITSSSKASTPLPVDSKTGDFQEVVDFNQLGRDFADVKQLIIACCNSLYDAFKCIPEPEKVAIEFGIKLAGETGVPLLTKASGEANFKINVEWKGSKQQ